MNGQPVFAESTDASGKLTLPANSLNQPLENRPSNDASDKLTDSVKKLLSGRNGQTAINNNSGTEPSLTSLVSINTTKQIKEETGNTDSAQTAPTAPPISQPETPQPEKADTTIALPATKPESQTLAQHALTETPVRTNTAQPTQSDTLKGNAKKLLSQAAIDAKINNAHDAPILPSMITAPAPLEDSISQIHQPAGTQAAQPKTSPLTDDSLEQATKANTAESLSQTPLPSRYQLKQKDYQPHADVTAICTKIGKKLSSVSVKDCLDLEFISPRFYSNNGELILEKHYPASPDTETPVKILFIGGIHGDEYSSISVTFKWLKTLNDNHSGAYDWHFLPLANPDGLLKKRATRVNANKVDLNRNFIPAKAAVNPIQHWQTYAKKRPRYFPGHKPLSEPESQAIHTLIDELKPDVIVSVHAPHGILDFDGSITPPRKLGPLYLKQLGTYPGSLGNYGWFVKSIPVMTIELKHAGIMPKPAEISRMWTDLISWVKLRTSGENSLLARRAAATQ